MFRVVEESTLDQFREVFAGTQVRDPNARQRFTGGLVLDARSRARAKLWTPEGPGALWDLFTAGPNLGSGGPLSDRVLPEGGGAPLASNKEIDQLAALRVDHVMSTLGIWPGETIFSFPHLVLDVPAAPVLEVQFGRVIEGFDAGNPSFFNREAKVFALPGHVVAGDPNPGILRPQGGGDPTSWNVCTYIDVDTLEQIIADPPPEDDDRKPPPPIPVPPPEAEPPPPPVQPPLGPDPELEEIDPEPEPEPDPEEEDEEEPTGKQNRPAADDKKSRDGLANALRAWAAQLGFSLFGGGETTIPKTAEDELRDRLRERLGATETETGLAEPDPLDTGLVPGLGEEGEGTRTRPVTGGSTTTTSTQKGDPEGELVGRAGEVPCPMTDGKARPKAVTLDDDRLGVQLPDGTQVAIRQPAAGQQLGLRQVDDLRRVTNPSGIFRPGPMGRVGGGGGISDHLRMIQQQVNEVTDVVESAFVGAGNFTRYAGNIAVMATNRALGGAARNLIGARWVNPEDAQAVPPGLEVRQAVEGNLRGVQLNQPAFVAERRLHGDVAVDEEQAVIQARKRTHEATDEADWFGSYDGQHPTKKRTFRVRADGQVRATELELHPGTVTGKRFDVVPPAAITENRTGTFPDHDGTIGVGVPTKGRLLVGDGTRWQELDVGTDGHIPTADSGEATGILWQSPSAATDASPIWGTGDDGAITYSADTEVIGEWHRTNLTIDATFSVFTANGKALIIRCTGTATINGALHADHFGNPGVSGGAGSSGTANNTASGNGGGGNAGPGQPDDHFSRRRRWRWLGRRRWRIYRRSGHRRCRRKRGQPWRWVRWDRRRRWGSSHGDHPGQRREHRDQRGSLDLPRRGRDRPAVRGRPASVGGSWWRSRWRWWRRRFRWTRRARNSRYGRRRRSRWDGRHQRDRRLQYWIPRRRRRGRWWRRQWSRWRPDRPHGQGRYCSGRLGSSELRRSAGRRRWRRWCGR